MSIPDPFAMPVTTATNIWQEERALAVGAVEPRGTFARPQQQQSRRSNREKDTEASSPERITDVGLRSVAGLQLLRHLDLSHCGNITDDGLTCVATLKLLQHLDLAWCQNITNVGLHKVAGLQLLQHLDLSSCYRITKTGLRSFHSLVCVFK
jgi:hypothetical protein